MAPKAATETKAPGDYAVGWVCALPKEQTAATAMLDKRHTSLQKPAIDPNTYTLGSIGDHNVVITCLPKGKIGNNSAATVVSHMISTFPSIKFGLMVGIGGGIPPKVRLGDVVVSTPVSEYPGVAQWDFGKAKDGGKFERTGALNNPPNALLAALTRLETEHELNGSQVPEYLKELGQKYPRLAAKYLRSDALVDVLFRADYSHVNESKVTPDVEHAGDEVEHAGEEEEEDDAGDEDEEYDEEEESCKLCDKKKVVKRKPRDMRVHYGLIASGNQVIKDAKFRDKLNKDLGGHVLCVEMEAAGIMNNFPCIIIRGICDYSDSHKNKAWQEHAAATAAAFAKELLTYVQPSDVNNERAAKDILKEG
jgi:nucleoside phosphorylase